MSGGKDSKKDGKKKNTSSSSEEDGLCSNCPKLTEVIESHTKTIEALTSRIEALEGLLAKFQEQQSNAIKDAGEKERVRALEEKVEERTNRQLRKTLVIRGVPEQQNERWGETDAILSSVIAKTLNVPQQEAEKMIDRCHRGGNPKYHRENNKQRPIYAAIHRCKDCETIIWEARKKKTVLVDYKYGPITIIRRNMALKKRREVHDGTFISKAHVAYPARLMGKGPGDAKHKLIEDFSKAEVKFKT